VTRRFVGPLVLGAALALAGAAAAQEWTLLKPARLFDGRSGTLRENAAVLIQGKAIAQVGTSLAIPAGARIVDLPGLTLMPGLIDAHTHIALHPGDYDAQVLRETPELRTIYAVRNALATLEAGVTTIRDLGNEGAGFADIALRDAVAKGVVPGPRVLAAIRPVTSSGAYRLVGYSPYNPMPAISSAADGPTEVRREVRKLVEHGADVIKIYIESFEKKPLAADRLTGALNYSQEELDVLVAEAHRGSVKVAAHTYSDGGARMAIAAGADTIEHGLYLTEETFRLMAQKKIAYVPTLLVYELWRDGKIFAPISPETRARLTTTVREHTASFKRALASGVRIVFGTDTFELPGTNAQELALMVRDGMPPADALRSATSTAADVLGIGDVTGAVEQGKSADLIAFAGDPLKDVAALQKVLFVMKEGRVVVDRTAKAAPAP
jgi:imidazolonepropionase-like amidohydrolase